MIDHLRAMSIYNRWMNARLYERCSQLSDEQRKRDLGAFFKSIHGTLNHLLLADRIWMARFTQTPYQPSSLDAELYSDFLELRAARMQQDAQIETWARSLQEADLRSELTYVSSVNPKPRRYPLWFAITHFFNHQTHHRGQLTTLLSQQGVDPGVTDLIWLPEYQALEQTTVSGT